MIELLFYAPIVETRDFYQWIDFSTANSQWPISSHIFYQKLNGIDSNQSTFEMVFEKPISPVVYNYEPFTMNQSMNLITWNGNESGDDLFVPTMYTSPPPILPASKYPYMNMNMFTDTNLKSLSLASFQLKCKWDFWSTCHMLIPLSCLV